jgi:hypothetical protein
MECGGKMKMKSGGKWIQSAIKNPGSFTKQAQSAGMSVPAFRDKVLANKEDYSSTTVKRANLAKTLSRMKKGQGGMEFKNPMAANQMPMEMESQSMPVVDINPLDNTVELLDPNMTQARQVLASAEKELSKQQEKDKVKAYQKMLNEKYGAGLVEDGAWGPKTQRAYDMYVKNAKTSSKNNMGFDKAVSDLRAMPTTRPTLSSYLNAVPTSNKGFDKAVNDFRNMPAPKSTTPAFKPTAKPASASKPKSNFSLYVNSRKPVSPIKIR